MVVVRPVDRRFRRMRQPGPRRAASIAITAKPRGTATLANLVVRNLDPRIVDALKQRASAHGRSAEAEHRLILEQTLLRPRRRGFAEVLAAMPDVGRDSDFTRESEKTETGNVFD